ncbi:MAG: hypothetical protein R3E89_18095 [Thiolinea sp.]
MISSTAAPLAIGKGMVERALKLRKHRPMFMVDIAVPRDIEPEVGALDDVYLYTVDDLQSVIAENLELPRGGRNRGWKPWCVTKPRNSWPGCAPRTARA